MLEEAELRRLADHVGPRPDSVVDVLPRIVDLTEPSTETELASGASSEMEVLLCEALADVMELESVPPTSNFFEDLGADSLTMAHFCARLSKNPDLPTLSIKKVYELPTIRSLALAFAGEDTDVEPEIDSMPMSSRAEEVAPRVGALEYALCGALQFLTLLAFGFASIYSIARGYEWVMKGSGSTSLYARSAAFASVYFVVFSIVPIVAKWVLVGRWKPGKVRVWSLGYFRFWLTKFLIQSNPLIVFGGTPIFLFYLRALGADIGRGVVFLSRGVPACPDLLTIGDGAIVRKDSIITCYRAHAGWIQTGPVALGRDSFVGEGTILDINSGLGDGAQLGHSSALRAGQFIPSGEHRVGTPAYHHTDVDYISVAPASRSTARRTAFSAFQLALHFSVSLPLFVLVPILIAKLPFSPTALFDSTAAHFSVFRFYAKLVAVSAVLFFGFTILGLMVAFTIPRRLHRFIQPDKVYPLYGSHFWVQRMITRLTNVKFFTNLFGDTSYVLHYLHLLGYRVSFEGQTGANFGLNVKHDSPYHVTIGAGTMAADGLSIVNAEYSATSFRLAPVTIGAHSFLGNNIVYPSTGKTGENCLHGTKVLVPVEGPLRSGVGFLGSPAFEIPRMVQRDREFSQLKSGDQLGRRLAAKNKNNVVTIGLFLLTRWLVVLGSLLMATGGIILHQRVGAEWVVLPLIVVSIFGSLYYVLVERAIMGFRPLRPLHCSMYDRDSWRVERYWKLSWQPLFLDGTPFKSIFWRLLGVKVGKRLFDDGCLMIDKTMVTVGDNCMLNAGSVIQPHSQEDGSFKSDYVTIGDGCTLGIGSLVHYGVSMGDGATLDVHSFLMKGNEVAPNTHWGENPARQVRFDGGVMVATTAEVPRWTTGYGTRRIG